MKKSKPNQSYTLKFVERSTKRECMPVIVTDQSGTRVGVSGSYNSFQNKEEVNRFVNAQKALAKHYGLSTRFDACLENFDLLKEITYTSSIKL